MFGHKGGEISVFFHYFKDISPPLMTKHGVLVLCFLYFVNTFNLQICTNFNNINSKILISYSLNASYSKCSLAMTK